MIAQRSAKNVSALLTLIILLATEAATAHTFAPALLELQELGDGQVAVRWKQPAMRIAGSNMQPILPIDCVGVGDPEVAREGTGLVASWLITCNGGLLGKSVGVAGIASSRADVLLRVELQDGRSLGRVLNPEQPGYEVTAEAGTADVLRSYSKLGTEHILTGWDHVLFVLGLALLVGWGSKLLWTVTAFTVGHSLTLALAALDLIILPQALVEVAIAGSIYVLAIELARIGVHKSSFIGRAPYPMASLFGLLHGLGFAGALRDVGLPANDIPLALFSFNIGIEFGQLLILLIFLGASWAIRSVRRSWPAWFDRVPAYGIGSLAVFWLFERTVSMLSSV